MSKAAELAALIGSQTALSNRNLIINGAMQVAQRGDVTGITTTGYYGPDRFNLLLNNLGTWSVSQSSTSPDGFANSLKISCTGADASPAAADYAIVYHLMEGQNLQHLQKGTSSAKSLSLSFYVRSSKTGTYNVNLMDRDNSNRLVGGSYVVNAADTWEYKTVTFVGDTSGILDDDNQKSLHVEWWLASGSDNSSGTSSASWQAFDATDRNASSTVNLADTVGNEWYITGVQLEVGETATPFEHRSYGDELARCMRYFEGGSYANASATGQVGQIWCWRNDGTDRAFPYMNGQYRVVKRSTPTVTIQSSQDGTANRLSGYSSGTNYTVSSINNPQPAYVCMYFSSSGLPAQSIVGYYEADAEL